MLAKQLLDFVRGKTLDYVEKKAERWYREEIDQAPSAFKFLEQNVDTLVDMAYEYQAQFLVAKEALKLPTLSSADYLTVCVRVPKRREMEDLEELIQEIEELGKTSSELRADVRARVQRSIDSVRKELAKLREILTWEEANGRDRYFTRNTGRLVARVSRILTQSQANSRLIERTGREIDEAIAEALTVLNGVKMELQKSQGGFAILMDDCNVWMNNWSLGHLQSQAGR